MKNLSIFEPQIVRHYVCKKAFTEFVFRGFCCMINDCKVEKLFAGYFPVVKISLSCETSLLTYEFLRNLFGQKMPDSLEHDYFKSTP